MIKNPTILAIDTSCDDTSVAVTKGNVVLSNIISSQTQLHRPFGGVFPTVAKQAHRENIQAAFETALRRASLTVREVDKLAVTIGPGLAPALEVGIEFAKNLSTCYHLPVVAINHVEGHLLSVLAKAKSREKLSSQKSAYKNNTDQSITNQKNLTLPSQQDIVNQIKFPVLSIITSGGHTQFVYFKKIGNYQVIGQTLDDAVGECLDKIGRMLNLGYPAGPVIEKLAKLGNPNAYTLPLPLTHQKTYDLSFSGIKTYARNLINSLEKSSKNPQLNNGEVVITSNLSKQTVLDLCASVQFGVFRHLTYKFEKILKELPIGEVWLGGGVAANIQLRRMLRQSILKTTSTKLTLKTPYSKKLCMDNAAMIGITCWLTERPELNSNTLERKPRWKISEL